MSVDNEGMIGGTPGETLSGFLDNGGGTVAVNGRPYAVGLIWEAIVAQGGKDEDQARKAAAKQKADLFCTRKNQYGLGSKAVGHRERMVPLAALLADTLQGPWVGVFPTDGGFYLTAVREDQVLPGFDRVINDRQEALDAFTELYYGSEWNQVFVPEEWEIPGAKHSGLEDLIFKAKTKTKLKSISRTGTIIRYGGLALVLMLAFFGYSKYQDYLSELEAYRLAQQAANDVIGPKSPPPPPPMPWEGKSLGVPTFNACVDAIMEADINVPGWKPESLTCENGRITLSLSRDGGTINWIMATLNRDGFTPRVVPAGDMVGVSWPHPAVEKFPKEIATSTVSEVRRYLLSQFEEVFQKVDMREGDSTAYYAGLEFSFRTNHDPKEFVRILEPIPALVIAKIRLDLASWTWQIEGNVYEKLPQPTLGAQ